MKKFLLFQNETRPLHYWRRLLSIGFLFTVVFFTPLSIAHADSIDVTASVPGPIPTSPALITSPTDQSTFTEQEITVKGTCPPEGAYVVLKRNNLSAGTAPCSGSVFEIVINLLNGANELQALVYNVTDNPGPPSPVVTLYYSPVQPPAPPEERLPFFQLPSHPVNPSRITPFTLEYTYKYQVRNEGQEWTWDITAQGGNTPYWLIVDWGDGSKSTYGPSDNHIFTLKHVFKKAGTYTPLVHGVDRLGAKAALQLLAVVNPSPIDETPGAKSSSSTDGAIPSYVILGAPLGAIFIAALIHAFVIRTRPPKLPKKLK